MSYYVELSSGKRRKVNQYVYQMLISAYGYVHLIRTDALEIICSFQTNK